MGDWPALSALIGGSINRKLIEREFDDVIRLAASIQQGTATASLILRKLSAYPRQEVRSRFGLLRTLAFRDALMGKASCFLWSRRMGCGKTSARSR